MTKQYQQFLNNLEKIFSRIENTLDNDDRRQTALSYWTIGKMIYEYKSETGTTVKQVALDLNMAPGSVQQHVRFYKLYPDGYPEGFLGHVLGWSDFRAVLAVRDKKVREWYLKESCRQQWGSHELRRRIRNNFYESACGDSSVLSVGTGRDLSLREQQLYTYSARVLKVVDADTLKVEVDVGFSMRYETKVRLRGINAPEKGAKRGEAAKKFVMDELDVEASQAASSQPLVVMRSYKSGKFGRFISDVWYLKGETNPEEILNKGKFLNQVLLDEGYAQKIE